MMYMPTWKVVLILGTCLFAVVFCIPNFFPRTVVEKWPSWVPSRQISLGLDLQGGSYFLLEVGIKPVIQEQLNSLGDGVRSELRKAQVHYRDVSVDNQTVVVTLREASDLDKAKEIIRTQDPRLVIESQPDGVIRVSYSEQAMRDRQRQIVDQSIEIVRRRVDETGTKEPSIQRQGDDRILLQLPGLDNPQRIKDIIGKTAKLEFRLVNENVSLTDAMMHGVPPNSEILEGQDKGPGGQVQRYVVLRRAVVGGDSLTDASPTNDRGQWVVNFRFDSSGGRRFCQVTTENVQKRLAIVLDHKVISAPVIQTAICGGSGIITGQFTAQSATDLAILLRAGALPAALTFIEERSVGPDLGADSIAAGEFASAVGAALVVVFMVVCYGFFGLLANFALVFNIVMIFAVMSVLGASLTLPGIAGIVLTVGMAVDANVLIYERVREELRIGRTPISALDAGYERAMSAIIDANLTTLISGLILFAFGSGPVRGFAVTLSVGLITTMFSAIMLTRLMIVWWLRRTKPSTLNI